MGEMDSDELRRLGVPEHLLAQPRVEHHKPPERPIRIGAYDYTLEYHDAMVNGAQSLDGQCRYADEVIRVRGNMAVIPTFQVLWHEVLHGICECCGHQEIDDSAIDALASGIVQVLRDNRHVVPPPRDNNSNQGE